ncbi:hypothetical protein J3L16_03880 [Alteromonas sp. 5E99-2]|uniref:glycoside hydrolase family 113 n=1 Tax=Alteromonas sp. 5E99-2 TaxID=2817683 RepID=UPI001A98F188|nr:hypothetical protein [Alteromonas sp. 5E99-2]MBO1254827.1 hypothetical protein [Alteromonas sp. 5E99-2]
MINFLRLAIFCFSLSIFGETKATTQLPTKFNGVTLEASRTPFDTQLLKPIKNVNANYIAIVPYAFINKNDAKVNYNYRRQWWGEKPKGIAQTIANAKAQNLKIMLKPHVWVKGDGWPGEFETNSDQQWKVFSESYSNYILELAALAEKHDVALFCIGTEFRLVASKKPDFWIDLISKVRKIYSGQITYASNWDNYDNIEFWPYVDIIGIDAYFPLSDKIKPSVEELESAWLPTVSKLQTHSKQWQKPILFTEFGYRNIQKAAGNHWELKDSDPVSMSEQANGYTALFNSLWSQEWFLGGFLWKWHLKPNSGGPTDNKFTPQGKEAENVIRKHYALYKPKD